MPQFNKVRRLVALCENKALSVQRTMARLNSDQIKLTEQIQCCETELQSIGRMLVALQINNVLVSKSDIYRQRKQQAVLLHQRQQVSLERMLHMEKLSEIEADIRLNHKLLVVLKRKEMKFNKWMRQGRQQWLAMQESVSEDEKQELFPWVG